MHDFLLNWAGSWSHIRGIQTITDEQEFQESSGGVTIPELLLYLTVILKFGHVFAQIVLAVGNYMNAGNQRVGGAIGFRIKFLTQVLTVATTIIMLKLHLPIFSWSTWRQLTTNPLFFILWLGLWKGSSRRFCSLLKTLASLLRQREV